MTDEELAGIEDQVERTAMLGPVQLMWLIAAVRQGHQDLRDCNEDRERACEFERRFEAERDEAQDAAEEYWEVWQDALQRTDNASLDAAYEQTRRQLAEENAARQFEFRANMERDWLEMLADRNRLKIRLEAVTENRDLMQEERDAWRNAFSRYKAHDYECDRIRLDGNEDPSRPCTCGLAEILKDTDGQLP